MNIDKEAFKDDIIGMADLMVIAGMKGDVEQFHKRRLILAKLLDKFLDRIPDEPEQ